MTRPDKENGERCARCNGPVPCPKHGRYGVSASSYKIMKQTSEDFAETLERLAGK